MRGEVVSSPRPLPTPQWVPPGSWIDRASGKLRTGGGASPVGSCPETSKFGYAVDCAPGFDKIGCLAKGCCWADGDNLEDGAPQCFFTPGELFFWGVGSGYPTSDPTGPPPSRQT